MAKSQSRRLTPMAWCLGVLCLLFIMYMFGSSNSPPPPRKRVRRKMEDGGSIPPPLPPLTPGYAVVEHVVGHWGLHRIRNGQPLRIAAGGLSRSGSTWQYVMLTLLLEEIVERYSTIEDEEERAVHSTYSHRQEDLDGCLAKRYCVVKAHEFMPDVVARVDAIFVSHRDARAVLESSAKFFSSCLYYGNQPLAAYFEMYAQWLPYAQHDMQFEAKKKEGDVVTIRRHAASLGVPCADDACAGEIASRIKRINDGSGGEDLTPLDLQLGQALHMDTHITGRGAGGTMSVHKSREAAALRHCNRTSELQLVEDGWGKWLARQGYWENEAEKERLEQSSNSFIDGLPQTAELMGEKPIGTASGSQIPRRTAWRTSLEQSSVWSYSQNRVNHTRGGPHSVAEGYAAVADADVGEAFDEMKHAADTLVRYALQNFLWAIPTLLKRLGQLGLCACAFLAFRELRKGERQKALLPLNGKSV